MKSGRKVAILADFPWRFFDEGATGRGGGQACTWLAQLAEEFCKDSRYEFHWISLDRGATWGPVERREWGGQFFSRLPAGKLKIDLALNYLLSRWLLNRELSRISPDLIHCWGTERSYPAICEAATVPSVLSMQGVLSHLWRKKYLPDTWVWKRMAQLEPKFLRAASVVTCESEWATQRVRETMPEANVRQVEYGVHPDFYAVPWEPDQTTPYALFVGSLVHYKGVDILLEAMKLQSGRTWSLKFAGDGPLQKAVESCGLPGVEWLGVLPWQDLRQVMRQATCLVHPTLADSSPNAVKEARVIGLPVITTVHGGQAGYIRNGENGIMVEPLDPRSLAAALSRTMDDPELARRMGATRHQEDRDYMLPARTAQGFADIYAELLGIPPDPAAVAQPHSTN